MMYTNIKNRRVSRIMRLFGISLYISFCDFEFINEDIFLLSLFVCDDVEIGVVAKCSEFIIYEYMKI